MRIFLAVRFNSEMLSALAQTMAELRRMNVRGSFTRPENLHLTLAFLGELPEVGAVHEAVNEVAVSPFTLRLGELGRFGDILWLGADGGTQLRELADAVRSSLFRHKLPFDRKPFKSHITLVRRASVTELPQLELPAAQMTVTRIAVMKSERLDGRLVYTEV